MQQVPKYALEFTTY